MWTDSSAYCKGIFRIFLLISVIKFGFAGSALFYIIIISQIHIYHFQFFGMDRVGKGRRAGWEVFQAGTHTLRDS